MFVGVDGEGLVEIGPTGMFSADTLVLSNSTASAVKFTFGGEGTVGTATVKRLVVAEGAKLNVDLSGVSGDDLKKLKYALVHFDEMEGRFAEDDIFVTVADASDARLNRAAIEYRNGGIYLSTPKTGLHLTIR